MEFSKLEAEAERKAANHVANMLHTPDKLEKVQILTAIVDSNHSVHPLAEVDKNILICMDQCFPTFKRSRST